MRVVISELLNIFYNCLFYELALKLIFKEDRFYLKVKIGFTVPYLKLS